MNMLYTWNLYDIVHQLYLNKKSNNTMLQIYEPLTDPKFNGPKWAVDKTIQDFNLYPKLLRLQSLQPNTAAKIKMETNILMRDTIPQMVLNTAALWWSFCNV